MKRILVGMVWCVVLYFVACIMIGAVAGAIAGANDPENAAKARAEAGARVVGGNRPLILLGSTAVGVLGTVVGWLPGTKADEDDQFGEEAE